ncbi:MAG: hypothetical protein WAM14_19720 [Candidatus Nitrosopolaris sp.]
MFVMYCVHELAVCTATAINDFAGAGPSALVGLMTDEITMFLMH